MLNFVIGQSRSEFLFGNLKVTKLLSIIVGLALEAFVKRFCTHKNMAIFIFPRQPEIMFQGSNHSTVKNKYFVYGFEP